MAKIKLAKHAVNQTKGPLTKREEKAEREEVQKAVKKVVRGEGRTKKEEAAFRSELEMIKARVLKAHGAGSIFLASEMSQEIKKVTTGIVGLDIALLGGLALSRINEKAGKFGSCKTSSDYKSHASFQHKVFPDTGISLIVNTEKEADVTHMRNNGMDLERTFISLPSFGDDAGDLSSDMLQEIYASKTLKILLSIDSVASLFPKVVQDNSLVKTNMGKQPNLVTRIIAKILTSMSNDIGSSDPKTTVSLLNQIRIDIGKLFGDPTIIPGGEGKKHWCSQIISLQSIGRVGEQIDIGTTAKDKYKWTEVHALKGKFNILKNKCHGIEGAQGQFRYFNKPIDGYSAGSFDNADQLFNLSLAFHLIKLSSGKKSGTSVLLPDGTEISSQKATIQRLKTDEGFFYMLYEALLEKRYNDFWNKSGSETYGEVIEEDNEDSDDETFFKQF